MSKLVEGQEVVPEDTDELFRQNTTPVESRAVGTGQQAEVM